LVEIGRACVAGKFLSHAEIYISEESGPTQCSCRGKSHVFMGGKLPIARSPVDPSRENFYRRHAESEIICGLEKGNPKGQRTGKSGKDLAQSGIIERGCQGWGGLEAMRLIVKRSFHCEKGGVAVKGKGGYWGGAARKGKRFSIDWGGFTRVKWRGKKSAASMGRWNRLPKPIGGGASEEEGSPPVHEK